MPLIAALALAAPAASPASAPTAAFPSPPAFALTPVGSMLLHGTRGRVLHGALRVRSLSRDSLTVVLQPADIRTGSNGNADYLTTPLSQTGRWLHLAAASLRLAPGAARQVAFTVAIPAGAIGGSHYAGIVATNAAELAPPTAGKRPTGASLIIRDIVREALPLTIRLPGALTRSLAFRFAKLLVAPVGAKLELGLAPGGSDLIESAQVDLRVLRGSRTVFTSVSRLGQLFPGTVLNYDIPWPQRPTTGSYRVLGTIRPEGAPPVKIDTSVKLTTAKAAQLTREASPARRAPTASAPGWVWVALGLVAALLTALSLAVYKLARRPSHTAA